MTRKEAIESLKSIIDTYETLEEKQVNSDVPLDGEDIQALGMAISALSADGDCISRTEVIKAIDEREDMNGKVNAEDIRTDIATMPSVQPVIPNMTITVNDSYMRNVRRDCGLYE